MLPLLLTKAKLLVRKKRRAKKREERKGKKRLRTLLRSRTNAACHFLRREERGETKRERKEWG